MRYPDSIDKIAEKLISPPSDHLITGFLMAMLILACNIEVEIGVRFILVFTPYVLCRNEIAQISGNMVLI